MAEAETDQRTPLLKYPTPSSSFQAVWNASDDERDAEFGGPAARQELEKNLLWKVDKRMSILVLIYILNYIVITSAARLRGFEEDLGLQGQQFATVLSVLYVGYISMQIPSNMLLNHFGKPSLYLPFCMMIWGLVSVLTGFATTFIGVLLTRLILGVVEASFFPGALFLISKWYKHSELGSRSGNIISNAFGALIASAVLDSMEGVLGRAAWRWLFYLEGSLTIVVAICAVFILPDFPETTKSGWLTEQEARLAIRRMEEDADADHAPSGSGEIMQGFWLAVLDPNVWILNVAMFFQTVANGFTAWFPTIVSTLGYSRTVTLLLCAPPYLFAAFEAFFVSRHSDKVGERFRHITVPFGIGIVGFLVAMSSMNTGVRFFSLFLLTQTYAGFSVLYGWLSNTFPSPPAKRAVALALINSISQFGNVAGSYVWQPAWAPTYRNSLIICAITSCCSIFCCNILKRRLDSMNVKLQEADQERGGARPGFRYLV